MPNLTPAPRPVDSHAGHQGLDGTPFLSFYDRAHAWSFVWDGTAGLIEISEGGYAEPVTYVVDAPRCAVTVAEFGNYCATVVREHGA